jgi:hypothetical protein
MLLEPLAGPVQPHPHRYLCLAQNLGDLRGRQLLPQAQPQHLLVLATEPTKCSGDVCHTNDLFGVRARPRLRLDRQTIT